MKALLDTNIILDHLLAREPFAGPATQIWQACVRGQYNGYVAPITPINVFYIARKLRSAGLARNAVEQILALFEVCPLSREMLKDALALLLRDFEDAVQCACAQAIGADIIIMRDTSDYANSGVIVLSQDPTDEPASTLLVHIRGTHIDHDAVITLRKGRSAHRNHKSVSTPDMELFNRPEDAQ